MTVLEPEDDASGAMWSYECMMMHETLLPYVSPYVWCPLCGKAARKTRRFSVKESQSVLFWDRIRRK